MEEQGLREKERKEKGKGGEEGEKGKERKKGLLTKPAAIQEVLIQPGVEYSTKSLD